MQEASDTQFVFDSRAVVSDTPDHFVEFDVHTRRADGAHMFIAHIRMRRWSLGVLRRMRAEWSLFREVCSAPVYASPIDDTPQWRKFVQLLGFEYLADVRCYDGLTRPLFINRI